jgi:hypothetical protein
MTNEPEQMSELFTKLYLMVCSLALFSGASYAQDTPHYDVVSEYVRQLGTMHEFHQIASKEFKEARTLNDRMADIIRNSTRVKLELNRNIYTFKGMKLKPPFEWVLPHFIEFYERKFEHFDTMAQIASEMVAGPKPGVDYGKIAATMPEISAKIEYIDKSLYEATPALCLLLVDEKPDSKGHMSHLVITRSQRTQLTRRIDSFFGARLRDKNPNYTVGSAVLIKTFLAGEHKSSDDPW